MVQTLTKEMNKNYRNCLVSLFLFLWHVDEPCAAFSSAISFLVSLNLFALLPSFDPTKGKKSIQGSISIKSKN